MDQEQNAYENEQQEHQNSQTSGTYQGAQTASEPIVNLDPPKQKIYKKWWFWAIAAGVVIFALILLGSGGSVQSDLKEYVNEDMVKTRRLQDELAELYEEVRGAGDDYLAYYLLEENVIPKSRELIEEAESIKVETEEVRELHEIYLKSINTQDQAFTLFLSALEMQDYGILTEVNAKLEEARRLMREYDAALEALADEHGLEVEE